MTNLVIGFITAAIILISYKLFIVNPNKHKKKNKRYR